jgi:hypothetical protein
MLPGVPTDDAVGPVRPSFWVVLVAYDRSDTISTYEVPFRTLEACAQLAAHAAVSAVYRTAMALIGCPPFHGLAHGLLARESNPAEVRRLVACNSALGEQHPVGTSTAVQAVQASQSYPLRVLLMGPIVRQKKRALAAAMLARRRGQRRQLLLA